MTTAEQSLSEWVAGHLPSGIFTDAPVVRADAEEIQIVGPIAVEEGSDPVDAVRDHRESTRKQRMEFAAKVESHFDRKVSWGARAGDDEYLFTVAAVPNMTRLRFDERQVLDTLVASGVARSRSDALAWCVRLVAEKEAEWLDELRGALSHVDQVRKTGPGARR